MRHFRKMFYELKIANKLIVYQLHFMDRYTNKNEWLVESIIKCNVYDEVKWKWMENENHKWTVHHAISIRTEMMVSFFLSTESIVFYALVNAENVCVALHPKRFVSFINIILYNDTTASMWLLVTFERFFPSTLHSYSCLWHNANDRNLNE